jgi:hypothetical protein
MPIHQANKKNRSKSQNVGQGCSRFLIQPCVPHACMQAGLASAFPSFHQTFSSDVIYDHFLPMAYRFLSNSAAAVRPVAAEGITCFLRWV